MISILVFICIALVVVTVLLALCELSAARIRNNNHLTFYRNYLYVCATIIASSITIYYPFQESAFVVYLFGFLQSIMITHVVLEVILNFRGWYPVEDIMLFNSILVLRMSVHSITFALFYIPFPRLGFLLSLAFIFAVQDAIDIFYRQVVIFPVIVIPGTLISNQVLTGSR